MKGTRFMRRWARHQLAQTQKLQKLHHQYALFTKWRCSYESMTASYHSSITWRKKPLMNKLKVHKQQQLEEEPFNQKDEEQESEQDQESTDSQEQKTSWLAIGVGAVVAIGAGMLFYLYNTGQWHIIKALLGSEDPQDMKLLAGQVRNMLNSVELDGADYTITEGTVKFNAILEDIDGDSASTAENEPHKKEESLSFFGRIWEGIAIVARFLHMMLIFSPLLWTYYFSSEDKFYAHLTNAFQKGGSCFIKFGQWIASRPDLFPTALCDEMERFHREGIEHSMTATRKIIEKAFDGKKLEEIFIEFDEKPVGSGSIAQVYQGVLAPNMVGNEEPLPVAIKVRHPSVGLHVTRDLKLLRWVVSWINTSGKYDWMRLDENIVVFAQSMRAQVDLRFEGRNLEQFAKNFEDIPNISFPKPYFYKSDLLIEEFIEGEIIGEMLKKPHSDLKVQAGALGTHTFLKMMVTDNFMHGDMHPGNIMVRTIEDAKTGKPFTNLVLIDAGLIVQLTKNNRVDFIKLFTSFVCDNAHDTALHFIDGDFRRRYEKNQLTSSEEQRFENFVEGITGLIKQVNHTNKGAHKIGSACQNLLQLGNELKIPLESNFTTLLVASIVVEGVGRQLDPQLPFLESARAMLINKSFQEASNHFTNSFKKLTHSSSVF